MAIRILIMLSILCMQTTGEPIETHLENRLDALEDQLSQTRDELRDKHNGLKITEQIIQEFQGRLAKSELKNRDLELILKEYNVKNDLKFREVYDRLKLTEGILAQTNEKLRATYDELTNTKSKIKSIETYLTTTGDEPKTTDADNKTTFSQFEPNVINGRQYSKNLDQNDIKHEAMISNVTNTSYLFDKNRKLDAWKSTMIKSRIVKRVDELGSIVAFHAERGPANTNFSSGQTIKFETTKQNYGNAYDSHVGIFTCPKSGLYFFTYTIMSSRASEYVEVKLVLNGSLVSYGATGQAPTKWNTGSQSVILPLHPGDRVWMEYQGWDHSIYGGSWSTFTGFIIKET